MATTVTLRNLYSEVETDDTRVLGSLYNRLACEDPNKNFAPAYKSGMWDGYHRFWNAKTKVFPTGLLNIAFKAIKQYDEDIDIIDERDYEDSNVVISPSIELAHKELGSITLRPYQQEAVELAIKKSRGVINIATNGGKCITKDSYVLTSDGYKTVETIFEENGTPCEEKDEVVTAEVSLVNRYGNLENTSHLTFNGVKRVTKVSLSSGVEMTNTHNHPVLVASGTGEFVWKITEQLELGDLVVTRIGDEIYGTNPTVSTEEGYALGALVADGYMGDDYKVSFTNNEWEILEVMEDYFKSINPPRIYWEDNIRSSADSTTLCMSGKEVIQSWKQRTDMSKGIAKDKYVPTTILSAPKQVQVAFLSGYFECECSIESARPRVEVTSASKRLLTEVQLMLKNMGILSTLKEKPNKKYPGVYYGRLAISASSTELFLETVNFKSENRQFQSSQSLDKIKSTKARPEKDNVPNGKELLTSYKDSYVSPPAGMKKKMQVPATISRTKVRELLQSFPDGEPEIKGLLEKLVDEYIYFDEVVSLEDAGEQPTFDVCMPETHSFIASSVVNHNTEVACGVIQQLLPTLPEGQQIVFLTGSKEIFTQSHKRISERLGMEVGKIGDGKWDIKPVTVAMIPSLSRYLKVKPTKKADPKKYKETRDKVMGFLHSCHGFIADEVHHASSDSWYKLLMAMEQAHYRIGLTGTVAQDTTLSYMRLVGSTGRILIKISNDFLINEGHSAKPVIHLHTHPAKQFNSPYDFARKEGIINCIERNKSIVKLALDKAKNGQQSLIIVSETEHGSTLEDVMQVLAYKYDLTVDEIAFIHGDSPKSLRNTCLDKFAEGNIRILIATSIMDEGVDISGINCVFLAAGGKSTRQVLQRIGRGLRKKADGSGVEVHDFIDSHNEYLMNHTEVRIAVYRREKFDIVKH